MKRPTLILRLASLVVLSLWFVKVYRFYFEFTYADHISLLFSLIVPFFVVFRLRSQPNPLTRILGTGALLFLPLLLQPAISFFLEKFLYTWVLVYLFAAICGVAMVYPRLKELTIIFLTVCSLWWLPFEFKKSQLKYYDKVVAEISTRKGDVHILKWKDDYWIHYNHKLLFSTIDVHMLREALVQPALHLSANARSVLIIGSDGGMAEDELSKFGSINKIVSIPFDSVFHQSLKGWLGTTRIPENLKVMAAPPQAILADTSSLFDLIIIDPSVLRGVEEQQYRSPMFYELCFGKLAPQGVLVTSVKDLYMKPDIFVEHRMNIQEAGFSTVDYHAQVPSVGQCAWIIGAKQRSPEEIKSVLQTVNPKVQTQWWNREAMQMMLSFGNLSYFHHLTTKSIFDENS